MPVFAYVAADHQGRTVEGVMDAPDARAVVERLQRDRYYPVRVVEHAAAGAGLLGRSLRGGLGRRVTAVDLVDFTQRLATLVEAGLPLDRALGVLEELTPGPRLRNITGDVLRSVRAGSALSEALAKHHPRPFSRLYVSMVRAGEKSGALEVTLKRLGEFLQEAREFRDAVLSALIYPALLTLVGAGAVVFLMMFVIPRFAEIFADLGQTLPLPTLVLMRTSEALVSYWWVGAALGAAAVLGLRLVTSTPRGRLALDRLVLGLPVVGDLIVKIEVARLARVLGTLLRAGVPVVGALTVIRDMMGNQVLVLAVERLIDGVKRGAGLARPMAEASVFPALAHHLVRIGEETGRLEEMLLRVSDAFEAEVRKLVKRLIGLLEPCIVLGMGLVVGVIVVAMLLAIFSISEIPL